jgi:hypothetical protein
MRAARIVILLGWGLLITAAAWGQSRAPGFLGRTTFLEYTFSGNIPLGLNAPFGNGLTNYAGTRNGLFNTGFYLRSRHSVSVYRCLDRRIALGAHVTGMRMGYESGYYSFANNFLDTLGQVRAMGLGLQARMYNFFSDGNIAPVGPFTEFGWTLFLPALRPQGAANEAAVFRGVYSSLSWYTGYNAALLDRYMFGFGLELQVPLLNRALGPLTLDRRGQGDESLIYDALRRHTSFNVRLSLSGLLF